MPEKKPPVVDRLLAALKKHGDLSLDDLAAKADTTKSTIYGMLGTLKKKHGVTKVSPGVYGLRQRDALAAGGELGRRKITAVAPKKTRDHLYAAALLDLQEKREVLVDQLAKLDRAIEAVEALAA